MASPSPSGAIVSVSFARYNPLESFSTVSVLEAFCTLPTVTANAASSKVKFAGVYIGRSKVTRYCVRSSVPSKDSPPAVNVIFASFAHVVSRPRSYTTFAEPLQLLPNVISRFACASVVLSCIVCVFFHPVNAVAPIFVTEAGRTIFSTLVQLLNAELPIVVRPSLIKKVFAVQLAKACSPISRRLAGSSTSDTAALLSTNVEMEVIPSAKTTFLTAESVPSQLHHG